MEVFVRAENVLFIHHSHFFLAKADNPELVNALTKYHREGATNNMKISQRLLAEYNISISYVFLLEIFTTSIQYLP